MMARQRYHELTNGARICLNDLSVIDIVSEGDQFAGFNFSLKGGQMLTYVLEFSSRMTPKQAREQATRERDALWRAWQEVKYV